MLSFSLPQNSRQKPVSFWEGILIDSSAQLDSRQHKWLLSVVTSEENQPGV